MATVTEEEDREEKLRLAIERIIPHCTEDAEHKVEHGQHPDDDRVAELAHLSRIGFGVPARILQRGLRATCTN